MKLALIDLAIIGTTALIGQTPPAKSSNAAAYIVLLLLALGFAAWIYYTLFYEPKKVVLRRYTSVKQV
jgi:hypothetical protein